MKFTIYGRGCNKCQKLSTNTKLAAKALGINCEVEKVTDMNEIIAAGIMRTPALSVDDEIIVEGKIPSVDALKKCLPTPGNSTVIS